MEPEENETTSDVVIVGGGPAGLSAGLMLGRARHSVVVIDAGEPRNAPADGVHAFLTRDGIPPAELRRIGRSEVEAYGGRLVDARVRSVERSGDGFSVSTDAGGMVTARALLIATGLVDELPDIPGVSERWGKDVIHCPFCHGWEFNDGRIGILGTGPAAVHQALLLRQWSGTVTLFLNDIVEPTDEEWEKLAARGVEVIEGPVERLSIEDDRLTGVALNDGTVRPVDAVVVAPRSRVRVEPFAGIGLVPVPHVLGAAYGDRLPADEQGATGVPGVWAAGNVVNPMLQVLPSAAQGATTGAAIVAALLNEGIERALAARRG